MATTKQILNYRFPQQCCGYCVQSHQNCYGDNYCNLLKAEDLIDLGGVCDKFEQDTDCVIPERTVNNTHLVRDCTVCKYSAYKNEQPWCYYRGKSIDDIHGCCSGFERDPSV